jgi:4-aminobutyrate aminotransferase-like enzyme
MGNSLHPEGIHNPVADNADLIDRRKQHFLPTAALYHAEPLQLVKAQGCYVWDHEGRRYLDAIGGIVCISAGHNHPRIKQVIRELLDADEIQHTSFTNSGSEANELAFMAARQATGETQIINLRHGYHGGTSGALAQCGHHNWRFRSQPNAATTSALEPYCYRCPFMQKPDSCDLECAKNVETTIQTSTHGRIAGMIVEPVMGVGGFIAPPKEYFDQVTRIVHEYGGRYISDEVQTGAGRCGGEFLLTKELEIDADMVTMAKGFGNGAAIGAVLMKSEDAEALSGKHYFNTFGGDPYQTAQAKATMEVIRDENLIANARDMGQRLVDGLQQIRARHPLIGDVRGRGLLLGIELVEDPVSKAFASQQATELMDRCKNHGLLLGKGGLQGNVIRIAPPLSIDAEQVDFMLEVIDRSLAEMA